jgi:2-iminobutanoate/2-iminopropanoate deaminase
VCSGQIPLLDGKLVDGSAAAQTRQCLTNLQALLSANGASMSNVAKTTVFMADMADFAEMNAVYAEVFGQHRPARSAVGVAGLPLGARIEIEAWAYLGP